MSYNKSEYKRYTRVKIKNNENNQFSKGGNYVNVRNNDKTYFGGNGNKITVNTYSENKKIKRVEVVIGFFV